MVSFRFPPTFIPLTPSSHPLMTRPAPRGKENGWPRSTELSNLFPFSSQPVECTVTVCPAPAVAPAPIVRSTYCNPDDVVTSFPSAPASRNGMTAPFLIVGHSTTMTDDNRVQ